MNPPYSTHPQPPPAQGGSTIRLVNSDAGASGPPDYPGPPAPPPQSHAPHDPYYDMTPAESNYWKTRPDTYADPNASSPYSNPAGAQSEPTIGPWDSASQRSVPYVSQPVPMPMPMPTSAPLSDAAGHGSQAGSAGRHLRNKPSTMTAGGLSYIDEEGGYHRSPHPRPALYLATQKEGDEEHEMRGLVTNAAAMGTGAGGPGSGMGSRGGSDEFARRESKFNPYEASPYAWPPLDNVNSMRKESPLMALLLFPTGLDRLLGMFGLNKGAFPIEQQIERKRHGVPGQRFPVATWLLTIAMTGVMVYQLIRNNALTGSPIATRPQFNYMIGPSPTVLINLGARFPPCMKDVQEVPLGFSFACLSDLNNPPTTTCPVAEICGHGLTTSSTPNQWWRFVVPIFLHVGVVHLLVNMLAQMFVGAQIEREMGTIPYLIVYFAGGVYGFVLGGNFGRVGVPSAGASGALFAVNACVLVDLILHWKYEERPKLKAFLVFIEFCIGIAIGYIPNAVDGLAHLGGFAMGILLGTILYPAITESKRRKYILWGVRVVALALTIMAFVLTIRNFYTVDPNAACPWCRYLSCFPMSANDYCKGTGLVQTTVQTTCRWLGL